MGIHAEGEKFKFKTFSTSFAWSFSTCRLGSNECVAFCTDMQSGRDVTGKQRSPAMSWLCCMHCNRLATKVVRGTAL